MNKHLNSHYTYSSLTSAVLAITTLFIAHCIQRLEATHNEIRDATEMFNKTSFLSCKDTVEDEIMFLIDLMNEVIQDPTLTLKEFLEKENDSETCDVTCKQIVGSGLKIIESNINYFRNCSKMSEKDKKMSEEKYQEEIEDLKNEVNNLVYLDSENVRNEIMKLIDGVSSLQDQYLELKNVCVAQIVAKQPEQARETFYLMNSSDVLGIIVNETYLTGDFVELLEFITKLYPDDALIGFQQIQAAVDLKDHQNIEKIIIYLKIKDFFNVDNAAVTEFWQNIQSSQVFQKILSEIINGTYDKLNSIMNKYPFAIKTLIGGVIDVRNDSLGEILPILVKFIAKISNPFSQNLAYCNLFRILDTKPHVTFENWLELFDFIDKLTDDSNYPKFQSLSGCFPYHFLHDLLTTQDLCICDRSASNCIAKSHTSEIGWINYRELVLSGAESTICDWNLVRTNKIDVFTIQSSINEKLYFTDDQRRGGEGKIEWRLIDHDWKKGLFALQNIYDKQFLLLKDGGVKWDAHDYTVLKIRSKTGIFY